MTWLRVCWPALPAAGVAHVALHSFAEMSVVLAFVGVLTQKADFGSTAALVLAIVGLKTGFVIALYEPVAARTSRRAWVWLSCPLALASVFAAGTFFRVAILRFVFVALATAACLRCIEWLRHGRRHGAAMAGQNPDRGAHDLK